MRRFKDGDTITIEPWRAKAFPVVKDLVVDRSAFDRIIAAGGYVLDQRRRRAGRQQDLIRKDVSDAALDSGRVYRLQPHSVAATARSPSAHLFEREGRAYSRLPLQGQQERYRRVVSMIDQADGEGFGSCSNEGECEAVCPKEIPISNIARMTRS